MRIKRIPTQLLLSHSNGELQSISNMHLVTSLVTRLLVYLQTWVQKNWAYMGTSSFFVCFLIALHSVFRNRERRDRRMLAGIQTDMAQCCTNFNACTCRYVRLRKEHFKKDTIILWQP